MTTQTITLELPESLVSELLADLNIYQMDARRDGMHASARSALRLGGEISRQTAAQVPDDDYDVFAGRNVADIDLPTELTATYARRMERRANR